MAVFGTVPSSTNAYTQGIRKSLVGKGIGNERITSGPGGVMVDNKPFIKPERIYGGTSFTSPQAFNNAWQQYSKTLQQPAQTGYQPTGVAGQTTGTGYTPPATGVAMQQQPTPMAAPPQTGYNQQIQDIIAQITKQATTPQQFTDVRQSPEYAAYAAQSARRQQEGIRAAQEALGSAGFGRSTTLGESAGRVAGQEQQYLESQVIPQLMAQQETQRQQQFQNILASLQPLQQQQQFAEQTEQERARLKGAYDLSPEASQALNDFINFKTQTEQNWMTMTPEQRTAARAQGDQWRASLQGMNVDPTLFGAGVTSAQAAQNIGRAGMPTLAGQAQQFEQAATTRQLNRADFESDRKFEFAKGQQDWENNFQTGQFNWQKAQQAWENTFKEKDFNQQMKESAAARGLDWASLGQRQKEFVADQAFREKQFKAEQQGDTGAKYEGLSPNQLLTTIKSNYMVPTAADPRKTEVTKDPAQRENMFLDVVDSSAGMSDAQVTQLLRSLGLKADEISEWEEKYGVGK